MKSKWSWPPGQNKEAIISSLTAALDNCSCLPWDKPTFGYPGTAPLPISVEALRLVSTHNANNIGDHSLPFRQHGDEKTECGFDGTQELERQAIGRLVQLCGGNPNTIGGYFCEGGTAANIAGLWMGRNYLRSFKKKLPIIITTTFAHYSIAKAADILGFNKNDIRYVGCNNMGEIDIDLLSQLLTSELHNGEQSFLFVLTAGSTMLGSVDNTRAVHKLRSNRKLMGSAKSYLHVDAAFGGLVLPFLAKPIGFGFDCGADSVIIDPHKMGGVPFGCGAILYRATLARHVTISAPYLNSEHDNTINGSRSGAHAAAIWAVLQEQGYDQLAERVERCMELRQYAVMKLSQIPHIKVHVGKTNQLCLEITGGKAVIDCIRQVVQDDPYYMHVAPLPKRFDVPSSSTGAAVKMILMPHHTKDMVDDFAEAIRL